MDERTAGRASYADDCGAWNAKTSTTTCTSFAVVDGRLLFVKLRDGIYCRGGRKGVWHPLQPQPQAQDVVRAHRHYATLQADDSYTRSVWRGFPLCPTVSSWQLLNIKASTRAWISHMATLVISIARSSARIPTLRRGLVGDKVKHRPPRDVYESMVREDSVNAPRDLQQV